MYKFIRWSLALCVLLAMLCIAPAALAIVYDVEDTLVAAKGEYVELSVTFRDTDRTVEWYRKGPGETNYTFAYEGEDTGFVMSEKNDGAEWRCYAVKADGYRTILRECITYMGLPLKITTPPADNYQVHLGERYTIDIEVQGDGLNYRWYYRNPGETAWRNAYHGYADYEFIMDAGEDGMQLYCEIWDQYGKTLETKVITVNLIYPEITQQPPSVSAYRNKTGSSTVRATGSLPLRYAWYVMLPGENAYRHYEDSIRLNGIMAVDNTLHFSMSDAINGAQAYCVITDSYGAAVTSETSTLTMRKDFAILQQPSSLLFEFRGEYEKASLLVSGEEPFSFYWYVKLPQDDAFALYEDGVYTNGIRPSGSDLGVSMTGTLDGAQALCLVYDKYGTRLRSDIITIAYVRSLNLPDDVEQIADEAFMNAGGFNEVCIPENVKSIGSRAFANCTDLCRIMVFSEDAVFADDMLEGCADRVTIHCAYGSRVYDWAVDNNVKWKALE